MVGDGTQDDDLTSSYTERAFDLAMFNSHILMRCIYELELQYFYKTLYISFKKNNNNKTLYITLNYFFFFLG